MINISNMRPGPGGAKATFDAEIEGWLLRDCVIVQRPDGNLSALPPTLRGGQRAVQIPDELWFDFINAARSAYRRISREEKWDEICAGEQAALAAAGI
ncbi:hypothetical protein [Shinella granuli]|uniref:hypothetical protein n=1 Tax=Shinella granuli TaxID=323621 RepID=UPI001055345A|nr:hypothetical protein [Shinella granuli]